MENLQHTEARHSLTNYEMPTHSNWLILYRNIIPSKKKKAAPVVLEKTVGKAMKSTTNFLSGLGKSIKQPSTQPPTQTPQT